MEPPIASNCSSISTHWHGSNWWYDERLFGAKCMDMFNHFICWAPISSNNNVCARPHRNVYLFLRSHGCDYMLTPACRASPIAHCPTAPAPPCTSIVRSLTAPATCNARWAVMGIPDKRLVQNLITSGDSGIACLRVTPPYSAVVPRSR